MAQPSFACPLCGYETFLPSDVGAGYCPMCAWWTGDSLLGSDDVLAQAEIDGPFATTAPLTSPLDAIHERPYCSTCGRLADVDIMEWTSATPVAYACEEHGEIRGDGSGEALPEIDPVMAHEIGVIAALRAQRFDRRTQYTPRAELETDWFGAPITRNAPRPHQRACLDVPCRPVRPGLPQTPVPMSVQFVPIVAVLRADHARRLSAWCTRQELTATLRADISLLGTELGWTEEMVKLGALLSSVMEAIDTQGDPP